jgi:hypothetical protein
MRWVGHDVRMEEGRGVYMVSVGRPEVKRPLGRSSRRWKERDPLSELDSAGSGYGPMAGFRGHGNEP